MSYSLLFDIGNVIIGFDFQISVRRIAGMCAVEPEQIFQSVEELKDDFESGKISPDQFLDQAIEKTGYTGERDFLIRAFQEVFELNEPMASLIEAESARGTPLYLLSNTNGIHVPYFLKTYSIFDRFDDAIYSHEVFAMKPDPKIYEIAISKLQLNPGKTIYIDDLPENCAAGRLHGLQAIDYNMTEHARFLERFEKIRSGLEENCIQGSESRKLDS